MYSRLCLIISVPNILLFVRFQYINKASQCYIQQT